MRLKTILLLTLALMVSATASAAQASASTQVSWTVPPFAEVGLQGAPSSEEVTVNTPLPLPTSADRTRGYMEVAGAIRLTVRSNARWTVLVQSLHPTLGTSHDGSFAWFSESLQVGVAGVFVPASVHPQAIVTGERGTHEFTVDYRAMLPEGGLPAGDYEAVLLYTVTTE